LEVPEAFIDQEMNMTRLSELLLFVLNRTTVGTDANNFESLLKLQLPGITISIKVISIQGLIRYRELPFWDLLQEPLLT
jgi:hypothetical protein